MKIIFILLSIFVFPACLFSQTSAISSQFDDAKAIAECKHHVSRSADTLIIHLNNGATKRLVCAKSESDGHGNSYYGEVFLFEGYLSKQGYFLVRQSWQDGDYVYLLIRDKDGYTFSVIDRPIISPNQKLFAMVSMDLITSINENAINLCEFAADRIRLIYNLEPVTWGPKDARWIGNDTLIIVKSIPTDSTFQHYVESNIFLVNRSGHWVLTE
jgi:hypothetical protein